MKLLLTTAALLFVSLNGVLASEFPRISVVEGATPTEALMAKPGTYLGEKFTFEDKHTGDVLVRVGCSATHEKTDCQNWQRRPAVGRTVASTTRNKRRSERKLALTPGGIVRFGLIETRRVVFLDIQH
jgi:hypothetical protein